ncbi:MAG: DUF6062 family protein [Lachnospiraceae bacterium]|nr:DUF6062 family protein [Lachnospiraceae bacterium]
MDEQLYAIPVNDAFIADCECPVCLMYRSLEKAAVEFTLGPSYMEDDVRMETNRVGFCPEHVKLMYEQQNRLGLALMLHTHTQNVIREAEKMAKKGRTKAGGLFKKAEGSAVGEYMKKLGSSCYICNRINNTFDRYIDTIFYLYKKEEGFRTAFKNSKGFCCTHYGLLYEAAPSYLSGSDLEQFTKLLDTLFIENMKRVCDDIEWYTDKFDYRNADAPWKNSRDAVVRTVLKLNSAEIKL